MALDDALLFISKCLAAQLRLLDQGTGIASSTGRSIEELLHTAVQDRLLLAERMLEAARRAILSSNPDPRHGLNRAYYSMYHTFRAVVFFDHRGDDHQEHKDLPKKIPTDFPLQQDWVNRLKSARLERNKADYDPYPKQDTAFTMAASQVLQDAADALPAARAYLLGKGLK